MHEFDYIEKYLKPLVNEEAGELKNDAAVYRPNVNKEIVISTDSLVEGIHFIGNENPRDIAKKCLRVNLSDIAAMGAKPIFYNLSLNIPKNKIKNFLPKFSQGLSEDQIKYNIKLIGGDLTASLKHINITITIFGSAPIGKSINRIGGKINDSLFVTGILGLSKIGLDHFKSKSKVFKIAKDKYLFPQPRVDLGIALRDKVNCMIDISDGLIQDANHLAKNSKLSIEIWVDDLPIPNFKNIKKQEILSAALYGGDDYELLFSCSSKMEYLLKKISEKSKVKISKIGTLVKFNGKNVTLKNLNMIPKFGSFTHF